MSDQHTVSNVNHRHRIYHLTYLVVFGIGLACSKHEGHRDQAGDSTQDAANSADAAALTDSQAGYIFHGVATHFESLGEPYGGCGVPQSVIESQNFVALNVQHTPGDYTSHMVRPVQDTAKIGAWNNGRNCGRWVSVTIGDACVGGINSGEPGKKLCEGGSWKSNQHSGATLNLLVTDSCQDGNGWCRDSQYHLDLSTSSLALFKKQGVDVTTLKNGWSNPQISWQYIDAPDYQGDIDIGFAGNASPYWPAIIINKLQRGLHKVEVNTDGIWQAAEMVSDMGQSYIMKPNASNTFSIRLYDADDQLINGGRIYEFSFPQSCGNKCQPSYTKVEYTVRGGSNPTPSIPAPPIATAQAMSNVTLTPVLGDNSTDGTETPNAGTWVDPYSARSFPYCAYTKSADANAAGWGWENNRSCKVPNQWIWRDPYNGNTYLYCFDPNTPRKNGWGWEQNHSCKHR